MINARHSNTKRQRRANFASACQQAQVDSVGFSLRKRATRRLKRMTPAELASLTQRAQTQASASVAQ